MANTLIEINEYKKAELKLNEVKGIFDYVVSFSPSSFYIAWYNYLKIQVLVNKVDFIEASRLIEHVYVIASLHLPENSILFEKIEKQRTLLSKHDI